MDTELQQQRLESAGIFLSSEELKAYFAHPDTLELKEGDSVPVGYKRCGHCGLYKKLYMFNQNSSSKINCTGNCKECQKKSSHKAYQKAKPKKNWKKYYAENRERKLELGRQYYQENKEQILAGQKKYQQTKAGKKAMKAAHKRRSQLLKNNAGIPWKKEWVIDRDKQGGEFPICVLCGKEIQVERDIHMEHLIPVALGGPDDFTNVGCAHALCNLQKSKDAREIDVEQVENLMKLSERYMDEHPELFDDFSGSSNSAEDATETE